MSKLVWNQVGEKLYQTGVEQLALFPQKSGVYDTGVAWNGCTAFNLSPSGAEPTALWADNSKYLTLMSAEEIGATIECYMYPPEFRACLGYGSSVAGVYVGQQARSAFGIAVKTLVGNDTEMNKHGYKLHLLYNCLAKPSEEAYSTVNDSPQAITFAYEVSTAPVTVTGYEPTAYICIDSTEVDAEKLKALEAVIYGSEETEARLPLPDEVLTLLGAAAG
jgi:hypothetical protein